MTKREAGPLWDRPLLLSLVWSNNQQQIINGHSRDRFFWKLRIVPHGDNPDIFTFYSIEKPVRRDNDFTVWQFRKLRQDPP